MFRILFSSVLIYVLSFFHMAQAADLENTLYLDLKDGRVVIEMYPEKAPNHVARIKELTRQGFYDGVVWHRVIDGFMAQTGDPTGTGTGGSGQKLKAEFNEVKHERGTVSMARASSPDSADSQFFICFADAPHLDGQYTAWGKVVEGMELVDSIKRGAPGSGQVTNPDTIVRIQVAADADKAKKSDEAPAMEDKGAAVDETKSMEEKPADPSMKEDAMPAEKMEEKSSGGMEQPAASDEMPAGEAPQQ